MKRFQIPGLCCLFFLIFLSCSKSTFVVINPVNSDLKDYASIVSRAEVNQYLPDSSKAVWVLVKDENGILPSQCDDLDGDGKWDELVFLTDLKAGEIRKITFEGSDSAGVFTVRTNIRFGRAQKPFPEVIGDLRMKTSVTEFTAPVYQMEGPAWETDRIAFRNYYDARNGMDIFGKLTDEMVMDSVGVNGREYHNLSDWGMDILKVGNSLGAGAIAIATGDSLYRIGPCEEGAFRIITEGPVRSIFELTYNKVPAGGRYYNIKHQVSVFAGDDFYRSKVWIDGLKGDENLVTGIVNFHKIPAETFSDHGYKIIGSLGNQAISGELLGMGIVVSEEDFVKLSEAPDSGANIVSTHLVTLKIQKEKPVEFGVVAAWEKRDPKIKDRGYFKEILKNTVIRIKHWE